MNSLTCKACVVWILALGCFRLDAAEVPKPVFYLPLDGSTMAAIASGSPEPQHSVRADVILTLVDLTSHKFSPGKVGQCCDLDAAGLVYQCTGNFRADEGA